ncbi:hypothetical protein E8E11_008991 [Didymella keratinophila]|nr:hypothetical protein E8E11_008991 [Didymella keratinophila]
MTKDREPELALLLFANQAADGKRLCTVLQEILKVSPEHATLFKENLLLTKSQLKEAIDTLHADQKPQPPKRVDPDDYGGRMYEDQQLRRGWPEDKKQVDSDISEAEKTIHTNNSTGFLKRKQLSYTRLRYEICLDCGSD